MEAGIKSLAQVGFRILHMLVEAGAVALESLIALLEFAIDLLDQLAQWLDTSPSYSVE